MKELLERSVIDCTIDKLTVIGTIKNKDSFQSNIIDNPRITEKLINYSRLYGFDTHITLIRGLGTSIDINTNDLTIRYEYNPNNFEEEHYKELKELNELILNEIKNIRLSRIDIALDMYLPNFAEYEIKSLRRVSSVEYKSASEVLQTKYYGVRESDFFYRLYDKATERQDKDKPCYYAEGTWRLEAQLNTKRKCEDFLDGLFTPFFDMEARPRTTFNDDFINNCKNLKEFLFFREVYLNRNLLPKLTRRERESFNKMKREYEAFTIGERIPCNIGEVIQDRLTAIRNELREFIQDKSVFTIDFEARLNKVKECL